MNSRQNDTVTRVDVRIPNHLYSQIQKIATEHFNAKIHHRSQKPEVTPTILELIQIGIEHFTASLPVENGSNSDIFSKRLEQLELRMERVESCLLEAENNQMQAEDIAVKDEGLSDNKLSKLLGMSSALITQYRQYGEANAVVKNRLKDWQLINDLWFEKEI